MLLGRWVFPDQGSNLRLPCWQVYPLPLSHQQSPCVGFRASQVVLVVKNPPANSGDLRNVGSIPGRGRAPGGGHGSSLQYPARESHGQRSLAGYGPQGHREADMTEATWHAHTNSSLFLLIGRRPLFHYLHT